MLIDHIGAAFPVPQTPEIFRLIGRIAFPVYAYLAAQGCRHTKNINKYLLRLGIFALISEIPFDITFMNFDGKFKVNFLSNTNVFYTLFLGVLSIIVYEKVRVKLKIKYGEKNNFFQKVISFISTIPVAIFGVIVSVDYGMYGIIYILIFYLVNPDNRIARTVTMFCVVFFEYGYPYLFSIYENRGIHMFLPPGRAIFFVQNLNNFWFALVAVLLVFLYNGHRGRNVKWAFYIFYPLHITILALFLYVI